MSHSDEIFCKQGIYSASFNTFYSGLMQEHGGRRNNSAPKERMALLLHKRVKGARIAK